MTCICETNELWRSYLQKAILLRWGGSPTISVFGRLKSEDCQMFEASLGHRVWPHKHVFNDLFFGSCRNGSVTKSTDYLALARSPLQEDSGPVPAPLQKLTIICNPKFQEIWHPLLACAGTRHTHGAQGQMQPKHHTHKKLKQKKSKSTLQIHCGHTF